MSNPTLIKRIWTDPVWSKVISAAILAATALLIYAFCPNWQEETKQFLLGQTTTPNWLFPIVVLALISAPFVLTWRKSKIDRPPDSVSSLSWFNEIQHQISDCSVARIYLRGFAHPDQFRPEHRDALLRFMKSLARRLESGADIEILAYHYPENEKSGLDWLKSELSNESIASQHITLISKQPVSNSSSMYLFDSGVMLYNSRNNQDFSYYIENLHGTVVHHLLEKGFRAVRSELK